MQGYKSWISNILIGANFLLFFLAISADKIVLPTFLSWTGHFHPLLLHLPLGIAIFSIILWWLKKSFSGSSFNEIYELTLSLSAVSSVFTALLGLFLSKGQDYDAVMLRNHLWSGVALSFFTWFSWWAFTNLEKVKPYWTYLQVFGLALMSFAGHAGGSLTHGADYLNYPDKIKVDEDVQAVITDSTAYFQLAVRPILEKKCVSCHKKDKAKGDLILASNPNTTSDVWVAKHANFPEMLAEMAQRIDLPITDKEHMPPRGKEPLEPQEIVILKNWINAGGNTNEILASIQQNHALFADKELLLQSSSKVKIYTFPFLSSKKLASLNDAFTVVRQIANESPALKADFFITKSFELSKLDKLSAAKEQIIHINLSKMPIRDVDLSMITLFPNLEKLILNQTDITDKGIPSLKKLNKIRVLSLSGTEISMKSVPVLATMKSLEEVYLWHTNITEAEYQDIVKKYKNIKWYFGFSPSSTDILPLNGPILENKSLVLLENDSIRFKKSIPGAIIRYTYDGSEPDSLSSKVYSNPLVFSKPVTLSVKIFKPGWISSPTYTFSFFKAGLKPDSTRWLTSPEPEYLGAGVQSLTDNSLGKIDQFRAGNWLGYKNNQMETLFRFKAGDAAAIRFVSVHYGINVQSYILAPQYVELWGGDNERNMTLIKKEVLPILVKEKLNEVGTSAVILEVKKPARYFKVIVKNVDKLPAFHPGKGDRGWIFIDEVFFSK
jgi:uncharacterized membrane protein/Leucine-rich repeat (LRR) protein